MACGDSGGTAAQGDSGHTSDDAGAEPEDVAADPDDAGAEPEPEDTSPGPDTDEAPEAFTTYTPCSLDTGVGDFVVALHDSYTSVTAIIADGVTPANVPEVVTADGPCTLYTPRSLFCDPPCGAGETCGEDGTCFPYPANIDAGTVTVSGLKEPLELTAKPPIYFYTNTSPLPHPPFEPGDPIALTSDGGVLDPFSLLGAGIEALDVASTDLPLEAGTAATLEWTPPAQASPARVHLHLSIANHGGVPAFVACDVEDTGSFEVPQSLVTELLGIGYSGWPSVTLTRQTADATDTTAGCVGLRVTSEVSLPVTIPGLVSCSHDDDCPEGQTCGVDLSCG